MAVDMFVKIGDLEGESKDKDHEKEIDVLSWSWGASQSGTFHYGGGGGAGQRPNHRGAGIRQECLPQARQLAVSIHQSGPGSHPDHGAGRIEYVHQKQSEYHRHHGYVERRGDIQLQHDRRG